MNIDEAIVHAREVADGNHQNIDRCSKCAEQHGQLADWLEELKAYRATVLTPGEIKDFIERWKKAAEPDLSPRDSGVSWSSPSMKFLEQGGCPFYMGELLSGNGATVLCDAVRPQLHSYVKVKFCEEGRKAYCPIWKAKNGH